MTDTKTESSPFARYWRECAGWLRKNASVVDESPEVAAQRFMSEFHEPWMMRDEDTAHAYLQAGNRIQVDRPDLAASLDQTMEALFTATETRPVEVVAAELERVANEVDAG